MKTYYIKISNKLKKNKNFKQLFYNKKYLYTTDKCLFFALAKKEKQLTKRDILKENETYNHKVSINKEKLINKFSKYSNKSIIGADEVGTSEYLRPIVVASCIVAKENINEIKKMNLTDSKLLTKTQIYKCAPIIMGLTNYNYKVLTNKEFNKFQNNNINYIKSVLFSDVIKPLTVYDFDDIIIDGFTDEENFYKYTARKQTIKDVKLLPKADSYVLSVVCASIIAKYFQYEEIKKIEKELNATLPNNQKQNVVFTKAQIAKLGPAFIDNYTKKKMIYTKKIIQQLYDKEKL